MKTLLLMRHAKASPSNDSVADFDRPLLDEGRSAAERIGKFLASESVLVDTALSSPAARARETIETVLQAAGIPVDVRYDQRLYESGPLRLIEVISEIEDGRSNALMVGHNPALEELVQILTGETVQLAAGTLAKIDLEGSKWSEIVEAKGALDRLVRPKELLNLDAGAT